MADSPATPRRHNRANWIALRTLRQVPRVVGETRAGEPIFQVRSVRLLLPAQSHHFSRLVACSKCGREVPGPAVVSPADLDHPAHQVICKECVRAATAPMFDTATSLGVARDPRTPDAMVTNGNGNGHGLGRRPSEGRLGELEERTRELAAQIASQRAELEAALERRMQEAKAELAELDANVQRLAEAKAVIDGARQREAALDRRVQDARGELSVLASSLQQLAGAQQEREARDDERHAAVEETRRRADDAAERLERLQAALDAAMVRSWSDSATVEQAREDVTRVELQLHERLERRSERGARRAASDALRLQALEAQVQAAVDQLTATVDEQRLEARAVIKEGLDELRTALAATVRRTAQRFEALEEQAGRHQDEMTTLGDVQATLDGGLGDLRSEIANLGEVSGGLAARLADIERQAVAPSRIHPPPAARMGLGRRSADVTARVAAVSATTEDLLRERQQLKAQLADVGRAADQATAASARASARASELAPLRSDVKALRDELHAQQDAVESLRRSVDRLRRRLAAPAAEPKREPKATKGRPSSSPRHDR